MRILFIAWDGPFVNYMEGLFLPIFSLLRKHGYEFHILHFTWAPQRAINRVADACKAAQVPYRHHRVLTFPHPVVGKFITLLAAHRRVIDFVREHRIETIMPRAMMPARIVLRVLRTLPELNLVFDADGLPIEERLDFAGLKRGGARYRMLKYIERNILNRAKIVLTRSQAAMNFLAEQYGDSCRTKLRKVINGRDENLFSRSQTVDQQNLRKSLGIPAEAFVSVYCGSLGPQYGVEEMIWLHRRILKMKPDAFWLVLTGNPAYFDGVGIPPNTVVRKVETSEIPRYLSLGNVAFALRKNSFSMRGVAPVKLGEYLLMGLPVVASNGIGDTGDGLRNQPFCYLLENFEEENLGKALDWMLEVAGKDATGIRAFGIENFGLARAVESYRSALGELRVS